MIMVITMRRMGLTLITIMISPVIVGPKMEMSNDSLSLI